MLCMREHLPPYGYGPGCQVGPQLLPMCPLTPSAEHNAANQARSA